tara:strand:+ start:6316 stop:6660 length:345 start_codon:yes stop_codon:yes gene_type:complete
MIKMSEVEDVQDYNDVQGMVQHAMDQDFNKANQVFGDIMSLKVQDLLDQEKTRLADAIYNNATDPASEEDIMGDDQLELDLEDETEEDTEEGEAEEDIEGDEIPEEDSEEPEES